MNFDSIQNKQLNEIEQLANALLALLVKAKMGDELITVQLRELAKEASAERVARFDGSDKQFKGF